MTRYSLLLKHGQVMLPGGLTSVDIGINHGRIEALGDLPETAADQVIDCQGLHILPGIIDSQVHFRDPGDPQKETLTSGMQAAALGGITTVFEMPNTNPTTTTPEALADKIQRAQKEAWTNYAFYLGGSHDNTAHLAQWENLPAVCGIKVFMGSSTGNLLTQSDEALAAILAQGKRIVAVHAEDEYIMEHNKRTMLTAHPEVQMHPTWRSVESCLSATKRLVKLAKQYGRRIHILHITTAEEMDFLAQNKDIATVEVLANHLTLHAPQCYEQLGTLAQQNPPIRDKKHQQALWQAIANGTVDIVASDHAPHTLEEKNKPYPQSPSGTPGVQTLLPIMLNHVHEGRLTLERLVDLMCYGPARIHQIANKGRIARGYDADFTVVDLKKQQTITNQQQRSKSGWTPFDGMSVTGWPTMTIVHGQIAMREDQLIGKPAGQIVRFKETLVNRSVSHSKA